jgi:hypothetical protein
MEAFMKTKELTDIWAQQGSAGSTNKTPEKSKTPEKKKN